MMRLYNSNFQPNHPNNVAQNPYGNQMAMGMNMPMPMPMPMPNNPMQMAQFGSNNNPHQFYGQTFPTNNNNNNIPNQVNQTGQPGIFGYTSQGPTNSSFFPTPNNNKNMFNSPK